MRLLRVRFAQRRPVLGEELRLLALVERGQHRAQGRAPGPLQDGVLPRQQVQVRGLPDVGRLAHPLAPAGAQALVGQEGVAGARGVGRHLERQPAAGSHGADQGGQQVEVVGQPLQRGAGQDDVHLLGRAPGAQVRLDELQAPGHGPLGGGRDHLRGGVDARDDGAGPALQDGGGAVASSCVLAAGARATRRGPASWASGPPGRRPPLELALAPG